MLAALISLHYHLLQLSRNNKSMESEENHYSQVCNQFNSSVIISRARTSFHVSNLLPIGEAATHSALPQKRKRSWRASSQSATNVTQEKVVSQALENITRKVVKRGSRLPNFLLDHLTAPSCQVPLFSSKIHLSLGVPICLFKLKLHDKHCAFPEIS